MSRINLYPRHKVHLKTCPLLSHITGKGLSRRLKAHIFAQITEYIPGSGISRMWRRPRRLRVRLRKRIIRLIENRLFHRIKFGRR